MGRLLDPMVGNSMQCLSEGHRDMLLHIRESNHGFATYRLLARRLYQSHDDSGSPVFETTLSEPRRLW